MKKCISLLLCLALLFSLTACGGGGASQTTAPTETTVPPTTTQPAPDASQIYSDAADAIQAADSLLVSYTINKEMTIGSDTYEEAEKVSLSLLNPGTEDFTATATRNFTWGDAYYADFTEFFGSGSFYSRLDGAGSTCAMTAEDYLSRYLPAVLLTPELYATVEFEDEDTIIFSDALGFEPWLDSELYTLVEASGTAELTAAGALADCTYHVVYTQGGVTTAMDVSFRTRIGPVDVDLPVNADTFTTVDNPNTTLAYERLTGMTLQAHDYVTNVSNTVVIAAGGALLTEQSTVNQYGTDKDLAVQFDYNYSLMDLSTQGMIDTYTQQEIFKNGNYSISTNGGAAQADRSVTSSAMENYTLDVLAQNFLLNDSFETMHLTDLGAVSLLEFTFTEAFSKQYTVTLCGLVYENGNLLNELASDYRTDSTEFFIGIDNATGLPTMLGLSFLGTHTIEGAEYGLACEMTQHFSFGTGDGYEAVMGEYPPAEEPEEKATPLLYHVTGAEGEEMWLFGTIHVGDERMAYLPQTVLDAFNASDALAVEFDGGEMDEKMAEDEEYLAQMLEYYMFTDGTTAADHISDEALYEDTIRLLKATGNFNSTVPLYRPVILSTFLQNSYLDLTHALASHYGADNTLLEMARDQEKEILSVESAELQMDMLTSYSDALQELLLTETVTGDPYVYQAEVLELYEMWCRGDEAELIAYLAVEDEDLSEMTEQERELYEEYWTAMSTDRNAEMLEVAKNYLSGEKVVFYAVGLAHLLAEDGLVNTLRDAGYTVELIPCA